MGLGWVGDGIMHIMLTLNKAPPYFCIGPFVQGIPQYVEENTSSSITEGTVSDSPPHHVNHHDYRH